MSTNAKDCENWYRLALSLEVCVKPLLLDILHDVKHGGLPRDPSLLNAKLLHIKTTVGIPHIIHYQWDILCPNKRKTNSNDFDITLIVALIKGLKILPEPKGGWSKPNPNDNSSSANVARAKDMRNRINHASMSSFTDNQTERIRKEIRAILQGLGATDFKEFDSLEKGSLDHRVEEKVKALADKINDIKSDTDQELLNQHDQINMLKSEMDNIRRQNTHSNIDEKLSVLKEDLGKLQLDVQILKNELPKLQSEVQIIHSRVDSVANRNFGRTLHFHLILKQTSGLHFEEFDVKLNGPLHIRVVDQLQKYFQKYCDDILDEIEITINEIAPVENEARNQQEDKKTFPSCIQFDCEVIHLKDPTYVYENLRNSLKSAKAKKIISDIETDLVSTIRDELHVESKILVRKWKVGSLLVDIVVLKIHGVRWETHEVDVLYNKLQSRLQKHFPNDSNDVHIARTTHRSDMQKVRIIGIVCMKSSKYEESIKRTFQEIEGTQYATTLVETVPYIETYKFNITGAGKIIGKKGVQINQLRQMPGIIHISLDTISSQNHCILTVKAESQAACRKVYEKVNKITNEAKFATYCCTLIDSSKTQVVLKLYDVRNSSSSNIPVAPTKLSNLYTLQHFQTVHLHKTVHELPIDSTSRRHQNILHAYSVETIEETFQRALGSLDLSKVENFEFNIIPGKIVFLHQKGGPNEDYKILNRDYDGILNLNSYKLKPVYITFINPSLRDTIISRLASNSFTCTNKDTPEVFTNVHLSVGDEKTRFSVRLALDENLEDLHELTSLQKKQQQAIERICKATTIQEVLQPVDDNGSLKVTYHRLSKLVHPDKCSHPGATEVSKKLNDAYKKAKEGEISKPALVISTDAYISSTKPPKVLSVRKGKNKICTITTFTEATLDVRASIVIMRESKTDDALSKHVRDVLNTCWENRDERGGIQTPDGKTGIFIDMIKQTTAGYYWVKEIKTTNGAALLEVQINEMRQKAEYTKKWKDCFEMNMKLIVDDREYKEMCAQELTQDFLTIKQEWEKIYPINTP